MLGPVQLRWAGGAVEAGPARQQAVLVALAADAGRPVPVGTLIDRIWDEDPPAGARAGLYSYITRLRRILTHPDVAGEAPARIVSRSGGYRLDLDPERVDAHRFQRLLDRARGETDEARRAGLLRQALALWAGPPLAGLAGRWLGQLREHLVQRRLSAVLALAPLELRAGRAAALIDELRALTAEHPLVEPLHAQLIRALRACGRSAEALEAHGRIRQLLADELGTDPGPELRELHQAMLRGQPDPPRPAAEPAATSAEPAPPVECSPAAAAVVPAHLPLDACGFTGRAEQLARLDALLDQAGGQATAVVISAIGGTAGIGKTALAVHWAHRVADRFPDGQLYVNLRGFDPSGSPLDPGAAIRGFLQAIGVPPERLPLDPDALTALYRSRLAGKRMLIVLDNARNSAQIRPLLPGAPGCLVLVTSRNRLSGLVATAAARPLTVDLLTPAEARRLLGRRLGEDRMAAEPAAVEQIIASCAGLPLALALVAARAATHPDFPLTALADELGDAQVRLEALSCTLDDVDIRAVFSWSYRHLDPPAARLFRLLGLAPGPDISAAAAASLAGLPSAQVRPLLNALTHAHLLDEHIPGRYAFHDLLRAYAAEHAHAQDSDTDRRAALHRLLDHYLHTAHAVVRLIDHDGLDIDLPPPSEGSTPQLAPTAEQIQACCSVERPVLLAAVERAAAAGFDRHAWQLAWVLWGSMNSGGHWSEQQAIQRLALRSAVRSGDRTGQAHAHHALARARARLGDLDDAALHYRHAIALYQLVGDPRAQAHAHQDLAWVLHRQGRGPEALDHAWQAVDRFRAARPTAHPTPPTAPADRATGGPRAFRRAALAHLDDITDREGKANTWSALAAVHHALGDPDQAIHCYRHALHLRRALDPYGDADILTYLGDAYHATGNPQAARDAWQQALSILDDLRHPDADAVRTRLHRLP
ncbi:AfsR/SARP family transcriptional regulator [Geodermatophilus sp. URMC 61]|uniref:AfsR/SARP family transcriptional regulator n=1 Tax=Geodermatophilus sp. URMC 61 TaxID=3423411 RepID=UPI00406C52D2